MFRRAQVPGLTFQPMTTYHVKGWATLYENNRSRKVKDLAWVPIPNRHDGERYSAIWQREDGPQLFAAWILILQVASKCHPRGSLVRSNGEPHNPQSLAMKTRAAPTIFTKALEYFSSNGWLTKELCEQQPLTFERHDDATAMPPRCQSGDEEQNGTEEKEEKVLAKASASRQPDSDWLANLQTSEAYSRIPINSEFDKATHWCAVKRRKLTRRFFIEWLNRVEVPMVNSKPVNAIRSEPDGWREALAKLYPDAPTDRAWSTYPESVRTQIVNFNPRSA